MRLLLDANLSWRMIAVLEQHFEKCFHVDLIGLPIPPKDITIWNYAKEHQLIIVTNDEDFLDFSTIKGHPPKVIILRCGNQRWLYVANLLLQIKEEIEHLALSTELAVLEIV